MFLWMPINSWGRSRSIQRFIKLLQAPQDIDPRALIQKATLNECVHNHYVEVAWLLHYTGLIVTSSKAISYPSYPLAGLPQEGDR
jgi:hypothetical protein